MDRTSPYYKQVKFLVQLLPLVAEEDCFVLKGGTAINLFVRDLPRFSVDIDLVYLPMNDRQEALSNITQSLTRIAQNIIDAFPDAKVVESFKDKPDALRLVVAQKDVKIQGDHSGSDLNAVYNQLMLKQFRTSNTDYCPLEHPFWV